MPKNAAPDPAAGQPAPSITRYECPECGHSEQAFYGAVKFHREGCSKPDYEQIEYVRIAAFGAAEATRAAHEPDRCPDHPTVGDVTCRACQIESHDAWMHRAKAAEAERDRLHREVDLLRDDLDAQTLRAEHAEQERDDISEALAVKDREWRHVFNRLREYQDSGEGAKWTDSQYAQIATLAEQSRRRAEAVEAKLDALRTMLTSDDVVRAMCACVREELRGKRWMSDALLFALMKSVAAAAVDAVLSLPAPGDPGRKTTGETSG
jgi:hypothetical protein